VALDTPASDRLRPESADDESAVRDAWWQGRVPLHLRVGITGHRSVGKDDTTVIDAVRRALDLIDERRRTGTDATPVDLTVVSALAEGADRLVAWHAMLRGASLEVVLPLPRDDYLADFISEESKDEFRALLEHAAAVTELAAARKREEAYERAGRAVVDRSDIIVALWDGRAAQGRGGTAEIVATRVSRPSPCYGSPSGGRGSARPAHLP